MFLCVLICLLGEVTYNSILLTPNLFVVVEDGVLVLGADIIEATKLTMPPPFVWLWWCF